METVRFEIIEIVPKDINPKIAENNHIKLNIENFNCLNICPNSFSNVGKRIAFGQSVKWKPKGGIPLPKKVAQFNKKGELITTFDSLSDAAFSVCKDRTRASDVSQVAKGKTRWFRGFIFKFIDENGQLIEPPKFKRKEFTKIYDPINKPRVTSQKFYQKSISGDIVKTWYNYELAAKSIGVSRGAIYKYLTKSKHLPHRGYWWEYA